MEIFNEVQSYINESTSEIEVDLVERQGVLQYWKLRTDAKKYLHIADVAKKYLTIPASSATPERVFSFLKLTLQKKTWSVAPKRLERVVFCRLNQKHFTDDELYSKMKPLLFPPLSK